MSNHVGGVAVAETEQMYVGLLHIADVVVESFHSYISHHSIHICKVRFDVIKGKTLF